MYHFVKVCTVTPKLSLGDCIYNSEQIINCLKEAADQNTLLAVFPELSLTGYYCQDLFFQSTLITAAEEGMAHILKETKSLDIVGIVGAPVPCGPHLYNCGIVFLKGKILGIVPKSYLPNYGEFYEKRWFTPARTLQQNILHYAGCEAPIDASLIFEDTMVPGLTLGLDICEDVWAALPPSTLHTLRGATILANLSASNELIGKAEFRRNMLSQYSIRTLCAYLYTSSGTDESSTDLVFSGHRLIYENGHLLAESMPFNQNETITYALVDLERIQNERLHKELSLSIDELHLPEYQKIRFSLEQKSFEFDRKVIQHPFVPKDDDQLEARCKMIFDIQAHGLARRMKQVQSRYLILGMSGGLDSTLALLVCLKTVAYLGLDASHIMGVTMPGFGTTDHTYQNALDLMKLTGVTLKEINITASATQHLHDIGHNLQQDVTYENAQARERTQILMDLANMHQGIVVGTADLSELALGWATFNGDHMAMYGVNASVPKTLVRYLIDYAAHYESQPMVQEILLDILDTPVSPELLPPTQSGEILQKTEDIVGPYVLHDFFIFYVLRFGFGPSKIYFLAKHAFKGVYDDATLLHWLKNFYIRFFKHQFKRSSLPDGPKIGSVCLSPRGDLKMPSDASSRLWLEEIKALSSH